MGRGNGLLVDSFLRELGGEEFMEELKNELEELEQRIEQIKERL